MPNEARFPVAAIHRHATVVTFTVPRRLVTDPSLGIVSGKFLIGAQDVTATFCASKTHKLIPRSADVDGSPFLRYSSTIFQFRFQQTVRLRITNKQTLPFGSISLVRSLLLPPISLRIELRLLLQPGHEVRQTHFFRSTDRIRSSNKDISPMFGAPLRVQIKFMEFLIRVFRKEICLPNVVRRTIRSRQIIRWKMGSPRIIILRYEHVIKRDELLGTVKTIFFFLLK